MIFQCLGGEYKRGGIAREVKQSDSDQLCKMRKSSIAELISITLFSLCQKNLERTNVHNPRILTTDGSDYWTKDVIGEVELLIEKKTCSLRTQRYLFRSHILACTSMLLC